jgi:hypothetical protein
VNREELDAFFTKAEDVLTDWDGSFDSMNTNEDRELEQFCAAILRPGPPSVDGVVTYDVSALGWSSPRSSPYEDLRRLLATMAVDARLAFEIQPPRSAAIITSV